MRTFRLGLIALLALGFAAPAQAQGTLSPSAATTPLPFDMVIGPQDLLEIRVFGMPELTMERRVDPDGTITLPLLDQVGVGGLTARQTEESIATLLRARDLVIDPQVSVTIKEYISRRVYVQGAVSKPGPYEMLGQRTLLDMVGEAGGLVDRAGTQIFIVRVDDKGQEQRIDIDAEKLIYEGDPAQNLVLMPGDIVMVPFKRMIRIYVNGAVANPDAIEFPSDERVTVLQAITSAGGTTDRANESRVQIIRQFADGTKEIMKVNLKRIRRGKVADVPLQANDIVDVPESFF